MCSVFEKIIKTMNHLSEYLLIFFISISLVQNYKTNFQDMKAVAKNWSNFLYDQTHISSLFFVLLKHK